MKRFSLNLAGKNVIEMANTSYRQPTLIENVIEVANTS